METITLNVTPLQAHMIQDLCKTHYRSPEELVAILLAEGTYMYWEQNETVIDKREEDLTDEEKAKSEKFRSFYSREDFIEAFKAGVRINRTPVEV